MAVWTVVPFRQQAECDRLGHWERLRSHLFAGGAKRAIVVEQTPDAALFNRGALLNHGALYALRRGARAVIFHDVDLLPDVVATGHYARPEMYAAGAVHLAASFERYRGTGYFGGVVGMCAADLLRSNGFPTAIWGWGGEDDAQLRRCRSAGVAVTACNARVTDLEGLPSAAAKMHQLRAASAKCVDKRERVHMDGLTWPRDGINTTRLNGVTSVMVYDHDGMMVTRILVSPPSGNFRTLIPNHEGCRSEC